MHEETELRRTWHLAWPAALSFLASQGMGAIDVAMITRLGSGTSAAVGLGHAWWVALGVVGIGITRGLDPVVAQAHGAGDRAAIARALSEMLLLALPVSAALAGWTMFAGPGLAALGEPESLLDGASAYAAMMAVASLPAIVFQVQRQFLGALGRVREATVAIALGLALKGPLNAVLIPALGAPGCAMATAICEVVMVGALLVLGRDTFRMYRPPRPTLTGARRLLSIGVPVGVQMGTEVWGFIAVALMMGWLGETALAAHNVAISLTSLSFMLPLGISGAAATRVGTLFGAGRPWTPAVRAAVTLGACTQLASSAAFLLIPGVLIAPYGPPTEVRPLAEDLVRIAGLFQLFDGAQVVLFGVLRGAGDVRMPTIANVLGYWVVGLPLAWILAFPLRGGPTAVWTGLSVGLAVVATVLVLRLRVTARRGGTRV